MFYSVLNTSLINVVKKYSLTLFSVATFDFEQVFLTGLFLGIDLKCYVLFLLDILVNAGTKMEYYKFIWDHEIKYM